MDIYHTALLVALMLPLQRLVPHQNDLYFDGAVGDAVTSCSYQVEQHREASVQKLVP